MRIAFIGTYNSIHFFRRTNWFAEHAHDVLVLSYEWELPFEYHPDMDIRTFDFERGKSAPLSILQWMREQITDFAPDIVHVHKCDYPGVFGLFLDFSPMVFTLWDGIQVRDPRQPQAIRDLIPLAGRKADLVTANSPGLLEETLKCGVPEEKHLLTSWGLARTTFNLDFEANSHWLNQLKKDYGIQPGERVIFSPRVAANFSNLDALMLATDALMDQLDEPVHIIFASYAETTDAAHSFGHVLPRLKHRDRFHWRGGITNQTELAAHYQLADVVASLYSGYLESSPASLIEGMLCGGIPVAAHLPVLDFWIDDGKNGYLCDCRDVHDITQALANGLKMAANNTEVVQANFDKVVKQADYPTTMRMVEKEYERLAKSIPAGFKESTSPSKVEKDQFLAVFGLGDDAETTSEPYVNSDAIHCYLTKISLSELPPPPSGDVREYVWAAPLDSMDAVDTAFQWLTDLASHFNYDLGYLVWITSLHPATHAEALNTLLLRHLPFHAALVPLYQHALNKTDHDTQQSIAGQLADMTQGYAPEFRHHLKTD